MKTIIYPNGYKGIYDDTLKEGDLITTYFAGIYSFTRFAARHLEDGGEGTPLAYFIPKFTAAGKKRGGKEIWCDSSYCRRAEIFLKSRLEELEKEKKALSNILQTIPNENNN